MSDGGALFRVRSDAQAHVKAQMRELLITNNHVRGYKYNAAVKLIKQINRVLEHQLSKELVDGMVGLGSKTQNTLANFKSNVAIKNSDVKRQSIAEAEAASSTINIVAPRNHKKCQRSGQGRSTEYCTARGNRVKGGDSVRDYIDCQRVNHQPNCSHNIWIGLQNG